MLYLVLFLNLNEILKGLCYNGDFKSNKFFAYTSEGNIKLYEIE